MGDEPQDQWTAESGWLLTCTDGEQIGLSAATTLSADDLAARLNARPTQRGGSGLWMSHLSTNQADLASLNRSNDVPVRPVASDTGDGTDV